jgi:haloalkane dehalogenase
MEQKEISPDFNYVHREVDVLDSKMAYIDTGEASNRTAIFLHGNPTSSYLWRNIIPHIASKARCIAPDLIGMGHSGKPAIEYRFADHSRYLSAFLDTISPEGDVVLVIHDWGSALGLDWARRNPDRVSGIVLMEFITPLRWDVFPEEARAAFKAFRSPETGRKLLIEENAFIESILPIGIIRKLSDAEMNYYREPFRSAASREPLYRWPNELPIEGSPADVREIVEIYHGWLLNTDIPKLLFWACPGGLIREKAAEWYAHTLKNVHSVGIGPGVHYVQEDNPHLIGREIAEWLPTIKKT